MLRAGLTEVPVMGMQTMWMSTSVRPMARPARLPAPFFSSVDASTTSTKMNVKTVSAMNACQPSPESKVLAPVRVGASVTAGGGQDGEDERSQDAADNLEEHVEHGTLAADAA